MSHLKASDIARELGISRSAAYEIMREMPRVIHKRIVRVTSQAFAAWRDRNTVGPWQDSIAAAKKVSSGFSGRTSAARRATSTAKPLSSSSASSSDELQIRRIAVRTAPRCLERSRASMRSKKNAAARGAR